jgi:hypothetical protein
MTSLLNLLRPWIGPDFTPYSDIIDGKLEWRFISVEKAKQLAEERKRLKFRADIRDAYLDVLSLPGHVVFEVLSFLSRVRR